MKKFQFQARIEQQTQEALELYQVYVQARTGLLVTPSDINRAIIQEGINAIMNKNGGIEEVKKVVNEFLDNQEKEIKEHEEKFRD